MKQRGDSYDDVIQRLTGGSDAAIRAEALRVYRESQVVKQTAPETAKKLEAEALSLAGVDSVEDALPTKQHSSVGIAIRLSSQRW